MPLPLEGVLVTEIERPGGDFVRGDDPAVHGDGTCFARLDRGEESVEPDFAKPADLAPTAVT